jgi:magnesium chelatase family protein
VTMSSGVEALAARGESTAVVRRRVRTAWERQRERQGIANGELWPGALDRAHGFEPSFEALVQQRGRALRLSPRRVHRAARVARTLADLDGSEGVEQVHLDEALRHRPQEIAT